MKKIIALALALVMMLGLVACGGNDAAETTVPAGESTPATDGATTGATTDGEPAANLSDVKVSVFWYDESDVYLGSVRDALNKELDALGVAYDNQYATNDQAKQLDQIRTAIAGGSNILVVNQVSSGAEDTAQDILNAAGDIPVIFFNRAIGLDGKDVEVLNAATNAGFIGTDAPEAGHMQGQMIGDYLVEHFDYVDLNKDGKISYAMMKGDEANIEAVFRTQYAVEDANAKLAEKQLPELEYFDASNPDKYQVDQAGAWSAQAAKDYMDTNMITYNEGSNNMIELVICNNDGMAEGVVTSLQSKGYNKDGGHMIPVFGVDATDNAKVLISEGAMVGSIKQDAEGMAAAIAQTVAGVGAGKTVVDTLSGLSDNRFSLATDCAAKLYIAYAPYTGE